MDSGSVSVHDLLLEKLLAKYQKTHDEPDIDELQVCRHWERGCNALMKPISR